MEGSGTLAVEREKIIPSLVSISSLKHETDVETLSGAVEWSCCTGL